MTDLKLIDELLIHISQMEGHPDWDRLRQESNLIDLALTRLQKAWKKNEMEWLTVSLSQYFNDIEMDIGDTDTL